MEVQIDHCQPSTQNRICDSGISALITVVLGAGPLKRGIGAYDGIAFGSSGGMMVVDGDLAFGCV